MLIKNIHLENSVECTDIRVSDGVFEKIESGIDALPGEEVIDGTGCMILPPFIESHVHLDTCLTAGDPVWNMSGTLFEGIECWSQRKREAHQTGRERPCGKGDPHAGGKRSTVCKNPCGCDGSHTGGYGGHAGAEGRTEGRDHHSDSGVSPGRYFKLS